jgi:hypothetical protein
MEGRAPGHKRRLLIRLIILKTVIYGDKQMYYLHLPIGEMAMRTDAGW